MVNLEWYQSFVAIYQAGTVTKAAEARFLTQPAVTQHLAGLETLVGEPLFQRTPRRMLPTQRGKELYSQIIQSLERLEEVSQTWRNTDKTQAQLPLIRFGTPREYFYESFVKNLETMPYRFWVQFGLTGDLVASLERGELDLIVATQRIASQEIEFHKIAEERFLLVCASGKQAEIIEGLASDTTEKQVSLETVEKWLGGQNWISYGVELPIIRRFWQLTFKSRPEFQPKLVIPDLLAIKRAVAMGYGISLLPDYLCQEELNHKQLTILWEMPKPVINELWLAYRKIERNRVELKQIRTLLTLPQP